jgi:Fe-S-cluster-containing hydrogenase component 2
MPREIRIRIESEHCHTCSRCLASESCKVRANLRIDPEEIPYLDVDRCYDYRLFLKACPFGAI